MLRAWAYQAVSLYYGQAFDPVTFLADGLPTLAMIREAICPDMRENGREGHGAGYANRAVMSVPGGLAAVPAAIR